MTKQKLLKTLEDMGLTKNEASVYLTALSLGPTTVKRIAEASPVKRTSIYSIVENLKELGLMHVSLSGIKQQYVAEHPTMLSEILERKKVELSDAMPFFMKAYDRSAAEDSISFVQGIEAVRTAYKRMPEDLKIGEPYYIITNSEAWYELDTEFSDKFIENRAKLGLDIKMLTQDSKVARRFKKYEKNYGMEVKFLPGSTNLHTNMAVTNKRVLIQQLTFPIVALIIENRSIIEMHQQLFEIMWDAIPE